ncbi:MAG TPA: GNAT family N-acetyltransferase [Streptosporangiaceae bacterium]|nr:GNAT family N-acetyltransferase [Streptosporangiaceae bacterium]
MTPDETIRIRPYHPGDRDQVMALAPRLTEGVARWRDPADVLAAVEDWIRRSIDGAGQPGHAAFVAVIGDTVAGVITLGERTHFTGQVDAYVGELVVRPEMQRRGVATELMTAAETWAAGRGLAFVTLHTGAANASARAFYAALGFEEEDVGLAKAIQPAAR